MVEAEFQSMKPRSRHLHLLSQYRVGAVSGIPYERMTERREVDANLMCAPSFEFDLNE
jgi:hypothetical protein